MLASVWLLAVSVRTLPLGTAYAVWTGIGVVGTVIVGILKFGESASILRLTWVGLIVIGLVGLKFVPGRIALVPRVVVPGHVITMKNRFLTAFCR